MDLSRRPATLCGVPLHLCPTISSADGEAGRGLDRGPVAGHFDRAEVRFSQSSVDRRNGDRDPRLHAAALFVGGRAPLPTGIATKSNPFIWPGFKVFKVSISELVPFLTIQ